MPEPRRSDEAVEPLAAAMFEVVQPAWKWEEVAGKIGERAWLKRARQVLDRGAVLLVSEHEEAMRALGAKFGMGRVIEETFALRAEVEALQAELAKARKITDEQIELAATAIGRKIHWFGDPERARDLARAALEAALGQEARDDG